MWTVPLVAAVTVIGALAMFVMLTPGGALAHEAASHGLPGPVTGLSADPATDDPATGELEGRSAITLTWNAPDTAVSVVPTGYRIDYSEDSRVWRNLVPNLTEAMADAYCGTSAAADQRCYTDEDEDLEPNTLRYYRVFAMSGNAYWPGVGGSHVRLCHHRGLYGSYRGKAVDGDHASQEYDRSYLASADG